MAKSKTLKKLKRKILQSNFVTSILVQLLYWYTKFVSLTSQWELRGTKTFEKHLKQQNIIALSWHGRALMLPSYWKQGTSIRALVSPHHDGRIIAKLLSKFKIKTIDGSSNDNASGAALNITRALQNKNSIVIVPDGPRGPRMKMSMSPIYFAMKTKTPIFAVTYSTNRAFIIKKSWDHMLIPKPFSKGIFIASKPIYIPQDLDNLAMEKYRLKVEQAMIDVQNEADDYCNLAHTSPATETKTKKRR